jgi:hypothetical protein
MLEGEGCSCEVLLAGHATIHISGLSGDPSMHWHIVMPLVDLGRDGASTHWCGKLRASGAVDQWYCHMA